MGKIPPNQPIVRGWSARNIPEKRVRRWRFAHDIPAPSNRGRPVRLPVVPDLVVRRGLPGALRFLLLPFPLKKKNSLGEKILFCLLDSEKERGDQIGATMGDDNAWVFDSLVGFLRGPVWNVPILTFIEHKSLSKSVNKSFFLCVLSSKIILWWLVSLSRNSYSIKLN